MKLPFKIGYEMTGIHSRYYKEERSTTRTTDASRYVITGISQFIVDELRSLGYFQYKKQTYCDGHCVEFPSPVFNSTEVSTRFYDVLSRLFKKHGLVPKRPETVCGGHHWHVSFPKFYTDEFLTALYRDATMRYFLPWVFTEPDDTESAINYYLTKLCCDPEKIRDNSEYLDQYRFLTERSFIGEHKFVPVSKLNHVTFNQYETNKRNALFSFDDFGTVIHYNVGFEFRGFEAPCNRDEFLDQQDFVIAYVNWVIDRVSRNDCTKVNFISADRLKQSPMDVAIGEFLDLVKKIGLDGKRYMKYVRRNLIPRWEEDRVRV